MDLSETLCNVGGDTLIYAGVKYTLKKFIDSDMLHMVNIGDIGSFIVSDVAYYLLLKNRVAYYFTSYITASQVVAKYGTIILGVTLINLLTDRKNRIVDNLISIGASGAVREIVNKIIGNISISSIPVGSVPVS